MHEFEFMTVREFADKMKVQRDQVYDWINYGRIKAIRVNDRPHSPWRIPYTELRRMHAKAYDVDDD